MTPEQVTRLKGWMFAMAGAGIASLYMAYQYTIQPVGRGEHLFIRFSFGVPIPFTGIRLGRGRHPRRGDVVLYRPPKGSNAPELLLGIVAGLPEEKVFVQDGRPARQDGSRRRRARRALGSLQAGRQAHEDCLATPLVRTVVARGRGREPEGLE